MRRVGGTLVAILSLIFPSDTSAAHSVSKLSGVSGKATTEGQASGSKGECFEYDVDFPGSDLAVLLNISSPADCMAICGEGQGCAFWTYDPNLSQCYIKSGSAFASRREAAGLVSGPRLCEYTDKCFDYGYDYTGYDIVKIEQQVVPTISDCQALCYANPRCAFFSWKSSTYSCYLKTSEAPMGRFKDSEVTSGPAACRGTQTVSPPPELLNHASNDVRNCTLSSSEYKGHDVTVVQGVSSAPACQVLCRNSLDCYYWTWEIDSKICSLKDESADTALVSDKTTLRKVSGAKRCIPTAYGCQRIGTSVVGENLGILSAASYDICQHLCVLHTGCAFWAFDNTSTTQNCRLFSERSIYVESTAPNDTVAGPAVCNADEVCYEQADYVGHDITDGVFGDVQGPDYGPSGECQQLCKRTVDCFYWTFYTRQKTCYLKDANALDSKVNDVTTLGRFSGPRDCVISSGCTELNTAYEGAYFLKEYTENYAECAARCSKHAACARWTYAIEAKVCALMAGQRKQVPGSFAGLISGPSGCPANADGANEEQSEKVACFNYNFRYPIANAIGFDNTVASPEECQILCKAKDGCMAFVYMGSSLCYLLSRDYTIDDEEVAVDVTSISGPKECAEETDILKTWYDAPFPGREDLTDPNLDDIRDAASFTLTTGACADKCEKNTACESWSYDPFLRELNCRLFKDRPPLSTSVNTAKATYSPRNQSFKWLSASHIKSGYKRIVPFMRGNFIFVGEPLSEFDAEEPESCRSFCLATDECEYWSIFEDTDASSKCRIFDYSVRNALQENELATSGTRQKPGLQTTGYKLVIEPSTGTAAPQEVKNSEECRAKCESIYNCLGFNYNPGRGTCEAITAKTTDKTVTLTLEEEEGTISSHRSSHAVQLLQIPEFESESTGAGSPALTANECLDLCKAKPCIRWTFASEFCFLDVDDIPNASGAVMLGLTGTIDSVLPDFAISSCTAAFDGVPDSANLEDCAVSKDAWTLYVDGNELKCSETSEGAGSPKVALCNAQK